MRIWSQLCNSINPVETQRLKTFVLGFVLPFVVFTLAVAPLICKPPRTTKCSLHSDTTKVLAASIEFGEQGGEDEVLVTTVQVTQTGPLFRAKDFLLTHPALSEHRIIDHAHDGRGPPSRS